MGKTGVHVYRYTHTHTRTLTNGGQHALLSYCCLDLRPNLEEYLTCVIFTNRKNMWCTIEEREREEEREKREGGEREKREGGEREKREGGERKGDKRERFSNAKMYHVCIFKYTCTYGGSFIGGIQ